MPRKKTNLIEKIQEKRLALSLILTRQCNLRCQYCYEHHSNRNEDVMNFDVAKDSILRYMNADDGFKEVEIEFFGGEPLLCFSMIKELVEWFRSQKWRKKHIFFIGTNGTIMNNEIKQWFLQNKQSVCAGFSIDGVEQAHNLCRDNSYNRVIENVPFFKENWPFQPAKMTITSDTIPYIAESVIHLENLDILFSANFVYEDVWGSPDKKKKLLEKFDEQLAILVDYYLEHPELEPVTPLLPALPEYLGNPNHIHTEKEARFCGAGRDMVTIDVDGTILPCHRFSPWVTNRPLPSMDVNRHSEWKNDKCISCKLLRSCPTCIGFNWEINGDPSMRTDFHCETYKLGVIASARIEAARILQKTEEELSSMTPKEQLNFKRRVETLFSLIEDGV